MKAGIKKGKRHKAGFFHPSGFTLIEVILAMTILGMVAVIIANSFHIGIDAWRKGENETTYTQRLRVLSGLLSQQLKSVYPYEMKIDEEEIMLFKGEPNSIFFVTTLTDSSFGGFKWVRYSYENLTLMYKEGILPDKEFEGKTKGEEKIVDEDLEEVSFSYYSSEEEEWNESWDFGEDLPGAVKVKISFFEPFMINLPMGLKGSENNKNEKTT